MKIKFQADNDFDWRVIETLLRSNPNIDLQTGPAAGLHLGVPDDQVLESAANEGRLLISHDWRTMQKHFARFVEHRDSPGVIILSKKLSIAESAYLLLLIWEASEAEEYINSFHRLPWS